AIFTAKRDQAINLSMGREGVEIINLHPDANLEEIKQIFAPIEHRSWAMKRKFVKGNPFSEEIWQKDFVDVYKARLEAGEMNAVERKAYDDIFAKAAKGEYPENVPRIFPRRIRIKPGQGMWQHGDEALDIANTPYESLSEYWQGDNMK